MTGMNPNIVTATGHVVATSVLEARPSLRVAAAALMAKPVKLKRGKVLASAVATVRQR